MGEREPARLEYNRFLSGLEPQTLYFEKTSYTQFISFMMEEHAYKASTKLTR
jgi:hypothetical protein